LWLFSAGQFTLNALEKLEAQFRKHIEEFRVKAARSATDDFEDG
jgi:hypothetical protein